MKRIEKCLLDLERKNKKAFVGFLPLGFPSKKYMIEAFFQMEQAGVDIIEIGFAGENPYMDGEVIVNAYNNTKKIGITFDDIYEIIEKIRQRSEIPIIVMCYKEIFENINHKELKALKAVGIDGFLVADMEYKLLKNKIKEFDLSAIPISFNNDYDEKILDVINKEVFLYCISREGVTGNGKINRKSIIEKFKFIRKNFEGKCFLGFGMGDIDNIKNAIDICDGVIIGSEIVKNLNEKTIKSGEFYNKILDFSKVINNNI